MNRHFVGTLGVACWLVALVSVFAAAQQPITGIPPLSSIAGGPFDAVDLANLNVHFSIPVFGRPGSGIPFSYNLSYDSLIWGPVVSGSSTTWAPVSNWGWRSSTEAALGYIGYTFTQQKCPGGQDGFTSSSTDFMYHDAAGGVHPFPGKSIVITDCGGGTDFGPPVTASDNSGYTLASSDGEFAMTVTSKQGITYAPPIGTTQGGGTVTDPNGNRLTTTVNGSTTTIVDTLGTTALTISGTAPNPVHYTYTAPSAAHPYVSVTYKSYTVTTQFGVSVGGSSIGEYSAGGQNLVDRVTLPDNSYYQFYYETTGTGQPYTGSGAGPVTARIAEVILPTGGTIIYTYGSGNSMMANGSPSTMTRALSGGTWTYTRGYQSGSSHPTQTTTTILDPTNPTPNETDLNFSGVYETMRQVYQGRKAGGTLKDYSYVCYNGDLDPNNDCLTATVTTPIKWTSRNDALNTDPTGPNPVWSGIQQTFDCNTTPTNCYGLVTQENDYNYASAGHHVLFRVLNINYNSSLCTGSHHVCDHPLNVEVTDGANRKSYTAYTYDNGSNTNGNLTSLSSWVSPTLNLVQGYSYNSNGTLANATDPNGTVTTYNYTSGSCSYAFPTSVTVQGLTTSYGYNCIGGVVTSVSDPNLAVVSTSYTDAYYWRPASVTDQLSNITSYSYPAVGQVEAVMTFPNGNGGNSTGDVYTKADDLGRPYLQQSLDSSSWDTMQYNYDSLGRLQYLFRPFSSAKGQGTTVPPGLPATTYTYDALGRYTDTTDWTGIHTDYSYNLNDVTVTVTPAPSGENPKSRQVEYDVLGRLTSVCEMSTTLTGVGSCAQNTAQTGYITGYQYDPLGNITNVSQGVQTRSFAYDGLSRMTGETHPETGGWTYYTYDSDSTCGTAPILKGNKVKRVDRGTNTTCYAWDGLHRLTSITYPSGPNTVNMPGKYYLYDYAQQWGLTLNNGNGRLTEAYTWLNGSTYSAEAFSYNARGDATDFYEATAHGGWYHTQQDYLANGAMKLLRGFTGTGTSTPFSDLFTYNLDGKGRPYGMVDTTLSVSIWNSTTYNVADQPTAVVPSAGGTESFTYDGNSGRMTQWSSTAGSKQQVGTLTWNANGTLQSLQINDTANPTNTQTCTNLYDDLGRLSSNSCAGGWGQSFSYDQFGNITKTLISGHSGLSFQPTYVVPTNNRIASVPGALIHYDGMGNMTQDNLVNNYTYDAEGRPITAATVQTTFDPFGRATEQNRNSVYTQIVYSPGGTKFAFMNGTTLIKYMAPMAAGMAAVHTGPNGNPPNSGYFQHADWLGSSRLANDGGGNATYDRSYAPFGEPYDETATTNRDFTGQTEDTTPGLYDFLFRQQSQSQGRWLVPDPAGLAAVDLSNPQTWNRYAYVANNPLSRVDPQGLDWIYVCYPTEDGGQKCYPVYVPDNSTVGLGFEGDRLAGNQPRRVRRVQRPPQKPQQPPKQTFGQKFCGLVGGIGDFATGLGLGTWMQGRAITLATIVEDGELVIEGSEFGPVGTGLAIGGLALQLAADACED